MLKNFSVNNTVYRQKLYYTKEQKSLLQFAITQ